MCIIKLQLLCGESKLDDYSVKKYFGGLGVTLIRASIVNSLGFFVAENIKNNLPTTRTLGISQDNLKYIGKEIQNIPKKNLWHINKIEILSENLKNEKILNFSNKGNTLFSIIRNFDLYNHLFSNLIELLRFLKLQYNYVWQQCNLI